MTKHTPGPWSVSERFYIYKPDGPKGGSLAEVKSCPAVPADRLDEHEANARLIAAAPEMLDAMEAVSESFSDDGEFNVHTAEHSLSEIVSMVRAAIAKAVQS